MLRGFYTVASGMMMQERSLGVLTNNMVNVHTPGYRASRVVSTTFEQEFLTRLETGASGGIGSGAPIRIVSDVPTKFDPGSLEETGRPYDVALDGDGFFNILVDDGQGGEGQSYLTRNGNFSVDENNYLILRGHGRVLGEDGPIQLDNANFTIDKKGDIYNERGRIVDRLLITMPPVDAEMELSPNGMFTTPDMQANQIVPEGEVQVTQGWLERSNVDLNREYTMVMDAQRAFQACSSALQILDKVNQKAATQIAGV